MILTTKQLREKLTEHVRSPDRRPDDSVVAIYLGRAEFWSLVSQNFNDYAVRPCADRPGGYRFDGVPVHYVGDEPEHLRIVSERTP